MRIADLMVALHYEFVKEGLTVKEKLTKLINSK
jgi:hypothetical protein